MPMLCHHRPTFLLGARCALGLRSPHAELRTPSLHATVGQVHVVEEPCLTSRLDCALSPSVHTAPRSGLGRRRCAPHAPHFLCLLLTSAAMPCHAAAPLFLLAPRTSAAALLLLAESLWLRSCRSATVLMHPQSGSRPLPLLCGPMPRPRGHTELVVSPSWLLPCPRAGVPAASVPTPQHHGRACRPSSARQRLIDPSVPGHLADCPCMALLHLRH